MALLYILYLILSFVKMSNLFSIKNICTYDLNSVDWAVVLTLNLKSLFFREITLDIRCASSARQTFHMKCHAFFSLKNTKYMALIVLTVSDNEDLLYHF